MQRVGDLIRLHTNHGFLLDRIQGTIELLCLHSTGNMAQPMQYTGAMMHIDECIGGLIVGWSEQGKARSYGIFSTVRTAFMQRR